MTPAPFPESNTKFTPPPDLADSQCATVQAYRGEIQKGSVEGSPVIVTAWQPTLEEIARIVAGEPIFISFMAYDLPPHYLCISFHEATHPD